MSRRELHPRFEFVLRAPTPRPHWCCHCVDCVPLGRYRKRPCTLGPQRHPRLTDAQYRFGARRGNFPFESRLRIRSRISRRDCIYQQHPVTSTRATRGRIITAVARRDRQRAVPHFLSTVQRLPARRFRINRTAHTATSSTHAIRRATTYPARRAAATRRDREFGRDLTTEHHLTKLRIPNRDRRRERSDAQRPALRPQRRPARPHRAGRQRTEWRISVDLDHVIKRRIRDDSTIRPTN